MGKNVIQEKIKELQNNYRYKMNDTEIREKINEIQATFGMTNTRLSEILGMPLNTLKQKKYNEKYRFFEKDLKKLKEFVKSNSEKL